MATISQRERAERLFRWKQDSVKALSACGSKEQRLAYTRPSYGPNG
ncbi:MAG: hypothetical protein WCB26_00015 [Pseudolabrys sp.]